MNRLLRYYRRPAAYTGSGRFQAPVVWDLCHKPDMLAQATKGDAPRILLDRTPYFVRRAVSREVDLDDLLCSLIWHYNSTCITI
jgi:hypothetical protein